MTEDSTWPERLAALVNKARRRRADRAADREAFAHRRAYGLLDSCALQLLPDPQAEFWKAQ